MSPRRSGGAARQTAGPGHSPVRSFNSREMPFWDDLDLTTLHDFGGRLLLVGVFNKPGRFRLDIVGEDLTAAAGEQVAGLFTDEIRPSPPFDYLGAQISAAVEAAAPTYLESVLADGRAYRRLRLPLWGDGRLSMVLGVIDWSRARPRQRHDRDRGVR